MHTQAMRSVREGRDFCRSHVYERLLRNQIALQPLLQRSKYICVSAMA
jgi:hypothetical protein